MDIDYEKLGFKCGIEIHQQLDGKKLFCSCPTINSTKEPDFKIERRLRAVAGETGLVDVAASHEMKKDKKFVYVSNSEDTCLVEFDEEPPHDMNPVALSAVLEIAQHLNAKIVDEIQVMRKTVIDGSNVSGFQRTALVAYDGYIETSLGIVKIPSICIEEEAAQKYSSEKETTTYKLDRLGIPLIEIATDPDIKTADHAKETAEIIGSILRSTDKVKRGLGTIRQDVNISIKGAERTEIKGFQDLKSIPKVINQEIIRQQNLIKKGKKIKKEVRKAEPDFSTSFLRPMPGSARMYPETDIKTIKPEIKKFKKIELLHDKAARFESDYGLAKDLAKAITKTDKNTLFETIIKQNKNLKPAFIAETLVSYPKELIRDYKECDPKLISDEDLITIFSALNNNKIVKSSIIKILAEISKGNKLDLSKFKTASIDDIESVIKQIIEKNKNAPMGAIMGMIMQKFKGSVDGKTVNELVKKHMKA